MLHPREEAAAYGEPAPQITWVKSVSDLTNNRNIFEAYPCPYPIPALEVAWCGAYLSAGLDVLIFLNGS